MTKAPNLLFVYGSLRVEQSAHHLLRDSTQLSSGELEGVELIEHQGYPMLCRGKGVVTGEVYRLDASLWPELDAYEEAPDVYQRVDLQLKDGRHVYAYCKPNDLEEADSSRPPQELRVDITN